MSMTSLSQFPLLNHQTRKVQNSSLAAARRTIRPADAAPLGTIRSLAYFLPVIEEVLQLKVGPKYFQHLRYRLHRAASAQ